MEEERKASLIDHLEELRSRILRSLFALVILFPAAWPFSQHAIEWVKRGVCPGLPKLYYMQPMELFFLRMKLSFALAFLVALPYVAWQAWAFVSPALFKNERKGVLMISLSSCAFFLIGAAFALFGVFPMLIKYSMAMGSDDIQPLLSASSFVGTLALLMLGFGLCFQLPVAVFILAKSGLVGVGTMRWARPYVVVGIFVVAGVITPPDMVSMLAMALPTVILYEASLLVASFIERKKTRGDEKGEGADA